jgi:hypothetical protein
MRRSTRDGLGGSLGTGMLLADETFFPGLCRASSASVFLRSFSRLLNWSQHSSRRK